MLEKANKIWQWYSQIRPHEKDFIARRILLFMAGTGAYFTETPKTAFNVLLNDADKIDKLVSAITAVSGLLLVGAGSAPGEILHLNDFCDQINPDQFDRFDLKHWEEMPGDNIADKATRKYYSLLHIHRSWFELLDNELG